MKFELSDEDFRFVLALLKKKLKDTRWVLDNKSPENSDQLSDNCDKIEEIVTKLENSTQEVKEDEEEVMEERIE